MRSRWNFYIKLTKQCNLRCKYCYEREYFKDPRTLSLPDMEIIFKKIKNYCLKKKIKVIYLGYTGGEVLTLGLKNLISLFALCRRTFKGSGIKVSQGVQTNLTLMSKELIKIFKKYKVSVGISFDVFGKQRKLKDGSPADHAIIDKMILMFKNRFRFGAIVVVNRNNFDKGAQICDFYKNISVNFHSLKMRRWPENSPPRIIPSNGQYIRFLKNMTNEYLKQKDPKISISNIDSYIGLLKTKANYHLCSFARDCLTGNVFIENSGDVYPCCSLRYKELFLGNILREPLEKIISSPVLKRLKKRYRHIQKECRGCKYLEICNGGCMGAAYLDGNIMEKSHSCCAINKAMFKYIGEKLKKSGQKLAIKI